ncbi:leucyl/phenylalanyl-tRNA--protein transferase [Flavobacteriaceae bacterium D16]|nr:leucyl/phenylalanyl-tRNA--protein transferase [Flavobacteriaceae bacterium D16]
MKKQHSPLYFLTDKLEFPPVSMANSEGLLAVGGDLSPERLILAYRNGIFPWFNEDSLILWWCPDPRMVLFPSRVRISKSMRKLINSNVFEIRVNTAFEQVIDACASIQRKGQEGTWITKQMKKAFLKLHQLGIAKSYEVWKDDELVGGLYGVDLGHVFCGESMFSLVDNASKFALIMFAEDLVKKGYSLIDCQLYTPHLQTMGAEEISRKSFLKLLKGED